MTNPIRGLVLEEELGQGATASVWKARHVRAPIWAAVKRIEKRPEMNQNQIFREIILHQQTNHPFIAKLFDTGEDETHYYLIQEFAGDRTLLSLLRQVGRLSENCARKHFLQLISAIDYLHNDRHIVHRDIKLENILIDSHDNIKLIDFGLGRGFLPENPLFSTLCGSPAYVAPEVIQAKRYTTSADIWSCGIVLFALTAGFLPFFDSIPQNNLWKICTSPLNLPPFISLQLADLLSHMLSKDPEQRISLAGIINHPWFSHKEYLAISDFIRQINRTDPPKIDVATIVRMESDRIDCKEVMQSILRGESTEMTLLYEMYLQQDQRERINELIMRTVSAQHSADSILLTEVAHQQTESSDDPGRSLREPNREQHRRPPYRYQRRPMGVWLYRPVVGSSGQPMRPSRNPSN
jgi:serine/threonine protein kinase